MEFMRLVLMCVLWSCLPMIDSAYGNTHKGLINLPSKIIRDGVSEPRGRHRLQLLFPLLIRISTRLATLVPTAMMALAGIFLFVLFSKKALIVSLFALLLSLSGKHKEKEDIYIHKINSYADYNGGEEHYYYHSRPTHYKRKAPRKKWKKQWRRTLTSQPHVPYPISLRYSEEVKPFKPNNKFTKNSDYVDVDTLLNETAPLIFPTSLEDEIETSIYLNDENDI